MIVPVGEIRHFISCQLSRLSAGIAGETNQKLIGRKHTSVPATARLHTAATDDPILSIDPPSDLSTNPHDGERRTHAGLVRSRLIAIDITSRDASYLRLTWRLHPGASRADSRASLLVKLLSTTRFRKPGPWAVSRGPRRVRVLSSIRETPASARSGHAICQPPLSTLSRSLEEDHRKHRRSTRKPISRGSFACASSRRERARTSQHRVSSHLMQVIPARRAPGREGRTGPDGTARPDRREGCSGKAREEGKLQRGPPTADHRPEQPPVHSSVYPPHRCPRYPSIETEYATSRKTKKKEKKRSHPICVSRTP